MDPGRRGSGSARRRRQGRCGAAACSPGVPRGSGRATVASARLGTSSDGKGPTRDGKARDEAAREHSGSDFGIDTIDPAYSIVAYGISYVSYDDADKAFIIK